MRFLILNYRITEATVDIQRKNIRKALNKAQENHADDVFDQTPLKAQAMAMSFSPSLATPDNFPVKGPLQLQVVATTNSPLPDLLRPADHDAAGAYINRLQRMRRAGAAVCVLHPDRH